MKIKNFLVVFAIFSLISFAQSKKNLELIFEFVDNSLSEVKRSPGKNFVLKFNAVDNLDVIKGRVAYNLKDFSGEGVETELIYTVDSLSVNYPEMFRDGLFGDYFLVRNVNYSGYYSIIENNKPEENRKFSFNEQDTVSHNELSLIETQAIDFTKGEVPAESFFDGFVETSIAVGAAVLSIVLFFIIRSD